MFQCIEMCIGVKGATENLAQVGQAPQDFTDSGIITPAKSGSRRAIK